MILSVTIIRTPRQTRKCSICRKDIHGPEMRLYGADDILFKPYATWTTYMHVDCQKSNEPKIKKARELFVENDLDDVFVYGESY